MHSNMSKSTNLPVPSDRLLSDLDEVTATSENTKTLTGIERGDGS